MSATPELDDRGGSTTNPPTKAEPPSPVEPGAPLGGWTAGARYEIRGDVHLHLAAPDPEPLGGGSDGTPRFAVWRYRGYEPLPRFLELLRRDGEDWSSFRAPDGRLTPVIPTLDVARLVGQMVFYWVQEDPRGPTLHSRLEQGAALTPAYALDIARQIGLALVEIHGRGLVHGDLDPANVHLAGSLDFVRLAWGGLTPRLESAGMDVGRGRGRGLAEVAPEVLMGKAPGPRADVYGLAALTYRMLTGQAPWLVRRNGAVPGVTANDPMPPLPDWLPSPLPEILSVGLQRDPDRRPPTIADFLDRLNQAVAAVAELPPPPGTWAPAGDGSSVQPTPPTVTRTLAPMERMVAPDPALVNTPPTLGHGIHGVLHGGTPLPMGGRSVAPALARGVGPGPGSVLTGSVLTGSLPPDVATPLPAPPHAPHHAPVRSLTPVPAPAAAGPQLAPFALGGLMVVGFTAVLAAILCGLPFARGPAAEPVVVPVPTVEIAQVQPPPAAPQTTLYSDPATADVFRDGTRVGITPMSVTLPAEGEAPLRLELRKAGYQPLAVEVAADRPPTVVERLVPVPVPAAAGAASVRPAPVPPAEPAAIEPNLPELRPR